MPELIKRRLGRTGREVTTLGLGGQGSIQWPGDGIDPVAIIEKAVNLGINYLDTSNIYGPSQKHFGLAFQRLGLIPGTTGYDSGKREGIYLASKTHIRTARRPEGKNFRGDFSEGMMDNFKVQTSVDDVRRSLSIMFGDGKGSYPEEAYLDCIQMHNINTLKEVDMLFEGFSDPAPGLPWMGSLAAMLDLRDGTNRSGCNPNREQLVRHIGISGHWSTAALMYAIQRDYRRIIDTMLVAINPSDGQYMGHRYNAIAAAEAAGMGVIGMKVFADSAYFHKEAKFSSSPADVYLPVGSEQIQSSDLVKYSLSVPGVCCIITGIGHIDTDDSRCQLYQNLAAAQIIEPLGDDAMKGIETSIASAEKHSANSYFQRAAVGLTAPRNAGIEHDFSMPILGHNAVRISWDTSYAGAYPIDHYEVLQDGKSVKTIPHRPQYTHERFTYDHRLDEGSSAGDHFYRVVAVDTNGTRAETPEMKTG